MRGLGVVFGLTGDGDGCMLGKIIILDVLKESSFTRARDANCMDLDRPIRWN